MDEAITIIGLLGGLMGGVSALYARIRYRDIERFRAQQADASFTYQTRFSRLHEKQIDLMADLYRLLVGVERALQSWTRPLQEAAEPSMEDKRRHTAEAANAFQDFFLVNRIWFSPGLVESIQRFNETTKQIFYEYSVIPTDGVSSESVRMWRQSNERATQDLPSLRKEIEDAFRSLLTPYDKQSEGGQ